EAGRDDSVCTCRLASTAAGDLAPAALPLLGDPPPLDASTIATTAATTSTPAPMIGPRERRERPERRDRRRGSRSAASARRPERAGAAPSGTSRASSSYGGARLRARAGRSEGAGGSGERA